MFLILTSLMDIRRDIESKLANRATHNTERQRGAVSVRDVRLHSVTHISATLSVSKCCSVQVL